MCVGFFCLFCFLRCFLTNCLQLCFLSGQWRTLLSVAPYRPSKAPRNMIPHSRSPNHNTQLQLISGQKGAFKLLWFQKVLLLCRIADTTFKRTLSYTEFIENLCYVAARSMLTSDKHASNDQIRTCIFVIAVTDQYSSLLSTEYFNVVCFFHLKLD